MIEQLRKDDFTDFSLQKSFLKLPKSVDMLNFNIRKMRKVVKSVDDSMELEIEIAASSCLFAETQSRQFDQLIAVQNNKSEDDIIKSHCIAKHLIANEIFNATTLKLKNDNPKTQLSDGQCRKRVNPLKEQQENELFTKKFKEEIENLSTVQTKCIKRKIIRHKYFEHLMRVQFLPQTSTSPYNDQRKKTDKEEFAAKMKSLVADVYRNC